MWGNFSLNRRLLQACVATAVYSSSSLLLFSHFLVLLEHLTQITNKQTKNDCKAGKGKTTETIIATNCFFALAF